MGDEKLQEGKIDKRKAKFTKASGTRKTPLRSENIQLVRGRPFGRP
jgi:hypothetical protein